MKHHRSPAISFAALTLAAMALAALAACATSTSPSPGTSPTPGGSPAPTGPPATATPGGQPTPTGAPGPSPGPTGSPAPAPVTVSSGSQAAALVLASRPDLFYGIGPPRVDVVGQCCWYQAHQSVDHYVVTVEIGWGDCPAGCINSRTWLYRVDFDGSITLLEERGDEPVQRDEPRGSGDGAVNLEALAGPICPAEQTPPDPECVPRLVAGAHVIIHDSSGAEIARPVTNEQGLLTLSLPEGAYYVVPQQVEGLMGTPEPVAFSVAPGGELFLRVDYDTGIR